MPAMKAMKAMKAKTVTMKAMKAMKAKTVTMKAPKHKLNSCRRWKRQVYDDERETTASGLTEGDLWLNKKGKIVFKKCFLRGLSNPWIKAVSAARKALNIKGYASLKTGSPLYNKAKELYKK